MPATLFVTAYDAHAVKAFEVHAIDYLLKPFDRDRFKRALAWAHERISKPQLAPEGFKALMSDLDVGQTKPDRFLVKTGERWVMVKCADIQWIDAAQFKRIHRSTIVNLEFVRDLQPWTGGDMTGFLLDGTRLTLSRTYRDQFDQWR